MAKAYFRGLLQREIIMKKYLILFAGLVFMALGTALCRLTGLGIDPANAFVAGLASKLGFGVGMTNLLFQGVLGIIVIMLNRHYLGWGSLVPIICFGYILQFFNTLLLGLVLSHLLLSIIVFVLGIIIIAFGMALYMESGNGLVPYDCYAYLFSQATNKKPFMFRVLIDMLTATLAFVLGGPVSLGTFVIAFGLGPVIDFFRKILDNNRNKLAIK